MSTSLIDMESRKTDFSSKYARLFDNYSKAYAEEEGMSNKMARKIAHQKALTDVVFNISYIRQAIKEDAGGDSRDMEWLLKNAPKSDGKYIYNEIVGLVKKIDSEFFIMDLIRSGGDMRSPNQRMLDGLIRHVNEEILLDLRKQAKKEKDTKASEWLERRLTELYWRR
ncbi:MAG: hypothetical protein M1500_01580 [Candidatus Marsarchaeota archaeon]|nr:hypothetical protein [Candidatus Marsarchaeota archaeon]MCL5112390.1 hypothetical protein [Candidatus Marsarchaeota archaeon]